MMDIEGQVRQIKQKLRLAMNGVASKGMRDSGISYKLNFGVELPRIKEIAASFEKDEALSLRLWKENIRECKMLAALLYPTELFKTEERGQVSVNISKPGITKGNHNGSSVIWRTKRTKYLLYWNNWMKTRRRLI